MAYDEAKVEVLKLSPEYGQHYQLVADGNKPCRVLSVGLLPWDTGSGTHVEIETPFGDGSSYFFTLEQWWEELRHARYVLITSGQTKGLSPQREGEAPLARASTSACSGADGEPPEHQGAFRLPLPALQPLAPDQTTPA